jgi:hypothetical protein
MKMKMDRGGAAGPQLNRAMRRRKRAEARRLFPKLISSLGHGDPRCGILPGGQAVRVFCPSCQPIGPRFPGDEPHLTVGVLGARTCAA